MEVLEKRQDGICILELLGRLDSNTSPEFEKKIFEVIDDGTRSVVVNFASLDYISSAGLRVLLKAAKELKRSDGKIVLCSMKDYIKEVFEIAGFVSLFPITSSVVDAVEEF
ncbi:MAG: STAS domain-containing protein [Deltaproteobacteria bacterium]|nr:STAS domain-containing protein [Deltaproteobacteria bacterium]